MRIARAKRVNLWYFDEVFAPLIGGGAEDDHLARFQRLEPENEGEVKELAKKLIEPSIRSLKPRTQLKVTQAFRYYLSIPRADLKGLFRGWLPPAEVKIFLVWIWEALYPDQDYRLLDWKEYVVIDDFQERVKAYRE